MVATFVCVVWAIQEMDSVALVCFDASYHVIFYILFIQILMSVQSNQTNATRLMLTVPILLVAMSVNVMLASLEMVVTAVIPLMAGRL